MLIDVNKIGLKGFQVQDSVAPDENMLLEDESYFLDNLEYSVHLMRDGEKVRAKGRIRTALSLRCVSCLDNYEQKVNSKFDIILFPVQMVDENSTQRALGSEDMEYIFFDGDEIDLERILMEQVNLFIPLNPVCSPYCKGMCPNCGTNLNEDNCQCENQMTEMSLLFDKIKR